MSRLKLCMLSSEMMPYAKTGGLADVAGALFGHLASLNVDVRAFMPFYASVRAGHWEFKPVAAVQGASMMLGTDRYTYSLREAHYPGTELPVYFVDCPALFNRPKLYTSDPDEHRRFLLFMRAAIESCQRLGFVPDVFHCNDWHTAFLPLYLRTVYANDAAMAQARSVLTIHNIGYQGILPISAAPDLGLGAGEALLDQEDLRYDIINPLKTGIKFADAVTTVSPTYAREICEGPLGMGMERALRARPDGVTGILNGVDYSEWDPRHDPHIDTHFDPQNLAGKLANKRRLLAAGSLQLGDMTPLLSIVSRLTDQKGFELLFDVLPEILSGRDCGLTVLGSGDARYVAFFERLVAKFPGRVAFRSGYDEVLAHLIEAGSDIFLMPSRYEPCGLNQMYSLRYGTIPIVHKTGGLADSVQHFDAATGLGTGCVFNDFDASAARWALGTTLDWYADRPSWQRLMQNAMAQDFSWSRQVGQYLALFQRIAGSSATRAVAGPSKA
ncbi:MAG: glycogen synthase [Steroidobacteraceae bacterium]|jgi:starch synthase